MSATVMLLVKSAMPVMLDAPNVATSLSPLGTVTGVQLEALFQEMSTGLRFQVALSATLG
jgi:hypothetical protein